MSYCERTSSQLSAPNIAAKLVKLRLFLGDY